MRKNHSLNFLVDPMNISLVHLTLAAAFSGPYITMVPASNWQRFTLQSANLHNFLANALFTTARMTIDIGKSSFKNFQDSAIVLSNAESFTVEGQKFAETQVREGGDGVQKGSFTGCVFDGCVNSNGDGGAVRSVGFLMSFDQCQFISCRASGNGGALYVLGGESASGWLGDWSNLATLPSVKINGTTFEGCVGGGSEPGHVIYTQAMQVGIFEFSAENYAESGSSGAVFLLWSNDVLSENGNMSMHKTVSGGDVSAFHVMYSGRDDGSGSFTGIPAVNHRFHQVDGFRCEYLYWAHVQNGIGSHVLDFIEVRNIEFVVGGGGSPAVFYAYRESSDSGHQLQINYCSVYGVEGNGKFYDVSIEDITVFVKFCTTNVSEWSIQEENINITFVEPDSPDFLSSDAEEAALPDNQDNRKDDENGLPGGAIAGIVISVLIIICIVIVVIVVLFVRRRGSSSSSSTDEHEMNSDTVTVCTVPPVDPVPVPAMNTEMRLNEVFEQSDSSWL